MQNQIEKEDLEKLKRGDIETFEKVLFVYERAIFGYIFNMVGQKETAEDLTQEVFMKLYKNLKSIDPEKSFKSWLYKIATNAAYDWFRAKRNKRELLILDKDDAPETIGEDSPYLEIEGNIDLEEAFKKIKPIHRTVLSLFYFEGFDYKEIASILSIPINTVKTHIRRGKESLKNELEEKNA